MEHATILVLSTKLGAQGLEGAVPIDPKRSGRPSGSCSSLRKRLAENCKMLNRLALAGGEFFYGRECFGMIDVECCFVGIAPWIRMIFISERCINFTPPGSAAAPQAIDCASLGNCSEPSRERAAWIVSLTRLVNGE